MGGFPNVLVYTHFVCSLAKLPEKAIYDRNITPNETWTNGAETSLTATFRTSGHLKKKYTQVECENLASSEMV